MKKIPVLLVFILTVIFLGTIFIKKEPIKLAATAPVVETPEAVPVIKPSANGTAPADAISLFDGKNLNEWCKENGEPAPWKVEAGVFTIVKGSGSLYTKRTFSDCQLHIEWRSPGKIEHSGQGRGNSGVWMQSRYEVQILDSYENQTYSDGQAGAVYKQYAPLVNASLKAGEWQTYDIVYTAPRFRSDSSLKSPAFITVFHNGILIHNHVEIKGTTTNTDHTKYTPHVFKCPLMLQDHDCEVSFRNIWIRELNVKKLFNQTDLKGWYTFIAEQGKNTDKDKNFEIKDSCIRILGKNWGYVCTERSYSDYYLKVVFKWGEKKFPPKEKERMDSGILYHFGQTKNDSIWPNSIEFQVQEQDCGDFWCIGTNVDSHNKNEISGEKKHVFRTRNFENPKGEWNTLEIIASGKEAFHFVNGHLVNSAFNLSVSKGKILLQSEGAEIYYKTVELMPY